MNNQKKNSKISPQQKIVLPHGNKIGFVPVSISTYTLDIFAILSHTVQG